MYLGKLGEGRSRVPAHSQRFMHNPDKRSSNTNNLMLLWLHLAPKADSVEREMITSLKKEERSHRPTSGHHAMATSRSTPDVTFPKVSEIILSLSQYMECGIWNGPSCCPRTFLDLNYKSQKRNPPHPSSQAGICSQKPGLFLTSGQPVS